MIYVTGDTHGARDFFKLLSPELSKLTKKDYVIICGDAGVVFNSKEAPYFINLYSYLPFTVLFVDGNHENFDALNAYPEEIWCGGKVHRLSNSVFHLKRGQVYTIENRIFSLSAVHCLLTKRVEKKVKAGGNKKCPQNQIIKKLWQICVG